MKTLIKEFNARKEQSSKKAVISRLLEDVNNACILALSFDKKKDPSPLFFDVFVKVIDERISGLISEIESYEFVQENSEVSDEKA